MNAPTLPTLGRALLDVTESAWKQHHQCDRGPGSAVERELANTELTLGGQQWGPDPVLSAYEYCRQQLLVAYEHVVAGAHLLLAGWSGDAHATLARAALDASARAWWVAEPELTVRQRVARSYADRIHGLLEASEAVESLSSTEGIADTGRQVSEISAEAKALGLEPHSRRGGPPAPARRPSGSAMVGDLLSGARELPDTGPAMAVVYAAAISVAPWVLVGSAAALTDIDAAGDRPLHQANPDNARAFSGVATLAYLATARRYTDLHGRRDDADYDSRIRDLVQLLHATDG
jgi:hypothetical protein